MALLRSTQKHSISAPDFSLRGTDGNTYNLDSFKDAKALLIVFMCNHCPYVIPKIDNMNKLFDEFKDKRFMLVGINPNDSKKYPEDSYEAMCEFVKEHHIKFPYLHDPTQEIAKAYGAVCTPDPFLFNAERKLVYQGRFDDALSPDDVTTTNDMTEAIVSVLNNQSPKREFLFSQGCSIKWNKP